MSLAKAKKYKSSVDPFAHSSWFCINNSGKEDFYSRFQCYSDLFYNNNNNSYVILFIGNELAKHQEELAKDYVNWVLNDSQYADAFITKSYDEGIMKGFELNVDEDKALVQSAAMAFRHPFEDVGWSWKYFYDLGYDGYESYALATNLCVENGVLYERHFNSNHDVIQKGESFGHFCGEYYKPVGESLRNYKGELIDISIDTWGCVYDFGSGNYLDYETSFTKENCDKILNKIKGNK